MGDIMNCVICNHECGRTKRRLSITMLGSTVDAVACQTCFEVVNKLRASNRCVFMAGPDIYLSGKPVRQLDVVFD